MSYRKGLVVLAWICALVGMGMAAAEAQAAWFASKVVSFDAGSTPAIDFTTGEPFDIPAAALGEPHDLIGQDAGFPNVLSPFSPPFERDEIVSIGEGGHITLQLARYALVGGGPAIGVFTNVGMIDADYPSGLNTDPAFAFGVDDALVEVSEDGVNFVSLGTVTFEMPSNYYLNAGPFDTIPPQEPLRADLGLANPVGSLSDFDGVTHAQMLNLFAGSGGGTWLNLDAAGLRRIGFIRFTVPDDGDEETSLNFELDAVSVRHDAISDPGDLNVDGVVNAADIDALFAQPADLNGDGAADDDDVRHLILSPSGLNTFFGDVDLDIDVDIRDLALLATFFGGPGGWAEGDLDGSGHVNISDLAILASNFASNRSAAPATTGSAVPEPASALAAAAALFGLLRRRDRRRP